MGYTYALQNPGLKDWRYLSQQIQGYESSARHAEGGVIYKQSRNSKTIVEALHESLLEKTNYWQNILEKLLKVTLMLAMCNLPFRGSSEELLRDN